LEGLKKYPEKYLETQRFDPINTFKLNFAKKSAKNDSTKYHFFEILFLKLFSQPLKNAKIMISAPKTI